MDRPTPLVVSSSALVDIGGGELVWTRVYTASSPSPSGADKARPSPPRPSSTAPRPPPPPRQNSAANNAALSSLVAHRPTILLLHGFPDTGELWDRLAPDLARALPGAAVVAPDLPGAGLSDAAMRAGASCPRDLSLYAVGSLARRMLALLSALGVGRAAGVVGHDFGAAVAWRMAMAAPARVPRLAALSVGHPAAVAAGGARQRARFWYYLFLALSPPDEAEAALARDDFALFRQVICPPGRGTTSAAGGAADAAGGQDQGGQEQEQEQEERARAAVDAYVSRFRQNPRLLRAATNLYRANYRAASFGATRVGASGSGSVPPLPSPPFQAALGIVGGADPALTAEQMRASGAFVAAPAAWECEVWERCGHWPTRDEPERLARRLRRFFEPACRAGGGGGGGGGAATMKEAVRARL